MKVSTRSRYAVAALYDLALHDSDGPVPLWSIAERQAISEPYLEQLMSAMRKSGLVRSLRGAQGGYVLARKPDDISIGDIVRAMDGPIAPVDCLLADEGQAESCQKSAGCIRRKVWAKMRDSINETLDGMTLGDLSRESADMKGGKCDEKSIL
jgi:Rrf2 family protein